MDPGLGTARPQATAVSFDAGEVRIVAARGAEHGKLYYVPLMSPELIAAVIAASVSLLTLIVSVGAQVYGINKTSAGTVETLKEQSKQLESTFKEQREQLDKTLAQQRGRTLNERFSTAADKLGSDKPQAVQLAGVYAMAGLADDWPENQQTCVDVLCAYLRLPYEPYPGNDASSHERLSFGASREVRHTVIRVITAHLRASAAVSWQGLNFDFTGVVFDGGEFSGAVFAEPGVISFREAKFSGQVDFNEVKFRGSDVSFDRANFTGGFIGFRKAAFTGGHISFDRAKFTGGDISFSESAFADGDVSFTRAEFIDGRISFFGAEFSGSRLGFHGAEFEGSQVSFYGAKFTGGQVDFVAQFNSGRVYFDKAEFTGGQVSFRSAFYSGSEVDFSSVADWSHKPEFDWHATTPPGVKLPAQAGAPATD